MAEQKSVAGKVVSLVGLALIIFTCFYDKIKGADTNILGPKSYALIIIGAIIVLGGLFCPACSCFSGEKESACEKK